MALTEPTTSSPIGPAPDRLAGTPAAPATLDDLMIAMDVVDTVRHREDLVRRELNETGREAELIARLKQIYREQGIEVPEHVLAEGVKALKESRFTYTPPPPSLKRTMLTLWATRARWGKVAAVVLAILGGSWGLHYWNVTRPAQLVEERTRIELTQTLPNAIRQTHADILKASIDPTAKQRADQLLADGERAIRDRDRGAMQSAASSLRGLRDDLNREYTLTIISRPGETSAVSRRPPKGGQTRNHYLIVEAIGPDGAALRLPIRSEETGQTETVQKFGVRVPQSTLEAVVADKRDDGIIQKNRFGQKRRGTLAVEYAMPFEGGMITQW